MAAKFEMVREFEGIQEYRMSNGLSVLLFPDSSQSTVTVNITYLVGSRHEGRGETGMAHLLEHMLFKGTPQFPDAKGVLQKHGGLFNATTWLDRTNYFETMPASDENLKFGLQFEADRMTHAWIRKQDLVSEMTVVRNEFEIGENDPIGVLHDQMLSAAYRWHNYGKSTIGNRSDIERVPVKNLKAFYKKYYQPDNAVLMIAGKFDAQKALGYVNEFFAKLPKPKRKLDLTYTEEPAQDGSRQVRLMRSGEVAAAGVVYHVPAAAHADFAAIRILVELYAQEPGGFLYEQLIKSGKASEMFGMVYPLAEPGVLMMMAKPVKAETVEVLLTDLIADLEQKQSQAITSEAVERAKTRMLKNYKMMASDSKKLALNLSESIAQGDYRLHFWARDQIKTVSLEDVQRVAKSYLIESNRTAGVFVPTSNAARAEISQVKDIAGMLSTYRGSEQTEQGDDFEATPENLEKHISRVELQNGIKAAFLPKKTRGHGVKANFILRYGTETSLTGQNEATALLPHWMMRGTQKKSFQQIQDEFDRLQSTARFNGTPGRTTVEISSDRDNIVSAIRLVAEILKSPALSVDEFEILRKKEMSELEEALADPKTLGFNELDREQNPWAQDSIHYVPTIPERISGLKALDPAQVQQLYHDQYGASHLELALVGSFEVEAVQHALNEEFGSWKAKQSFERIIKPYRPTSAGLKVIQTPDKQMALLAMGMNLPLQDNATNYPAMRIGAYVLGESMQSRIWNRLREQGGLSYGAGSWLEASKMTANASLGLYAMAATDNAEKALNALSEELNKWQSKGITEQELQESKESFCSMVQNMLANDAYVVASLSGNLELGRTFEFQADLLQRIQALTTQEVLAAIEQYTKTAPIAQVKAGDFKH
ncbi:MAG: insulinase family protein [Myxococcaceae bacterium]|nr:insulinase family protein [Myxococcaceae bacterium]MBH2005835.1 insulinase family protein [Myxococcaceae bacterium]